MARYIPYIPEILIGTFFVAFAVFYVVSFLRQVIHVSRVVDRTHVDPTKPLKLTGQWFFLIAVLLAATSALLFLFFRRYALWIEIVGIVGAFALLAWCSDKLTELYTDRLVPLLGEEKKKEKDRTVSPRA